MPSVTTVVMSEQDTMNQHNRRPTASTWNRQTMSFRIDLSYAYQNYFGIYFCQASKSGRLLTTVTATVLLGDTKIVPADGLYTKTVNKGDDDVVIEMTGIVSSLNEFAWRFNNSDILRRGSSSYTITRAVTINDAGVYECHYLHERYSARHGLVRLIVRRCPAGRWGPPECLGVCDNCYHGGVCNDLNGRCVCPAGFSGRNCLHVCPFGKFGASCLQTCHCRQGSTCNRFTGECSGGCAQGWTGLSCQIPDACPDDFYDVNCTSKCQCLENRPCNKQTGQCPSECKPGFVVYPEALNCQECRDGTFGLNCIGICHCNERNCVKSTGVCDGGCKNNWAEPDCTIGVLSFNNTQANSGQPSTFTCVVTGSPLPAVTAVKVYRYSNGVHYLSNTRSLIGLELVLAFEFPAVELGEEFICQITEPYAAYPLTAEMYELPALTRKPRVAETRARQVAIEWDPWSQEAGDPGDPPITAYTVYYRPETGQFTEWKRGTEVSSNRLSATVDNLAPNTSYELGVTVTREGVGGEGARSPTLSVQTPCTEPLKPPDDIRVFSQQEIKRQITVTWQDLQDVFHGCRTGIKQYRIRYTNMDTGTSETDIVGGEVTVVNITGLGPYVQYGFSISAVNEVGTGAWSDVIMTYTAEETPPPPQTVTVPRSTTSSITVLSVATSPYNLNGNVSHYLIQYSQVTEGALSEATVERINQTGFKMTYTISGLPARTDYSIQVKIVNGVGESEWSQAVQATTVNTGNPGSQSGSRGSVAGGIIAAFLVLIAIVVFLVWQRRRKKDSQRQATSKTETIYKNITYDNSINEHQETVDDVSLDAPKSIKIQKTTDVETTIYANAGMAPDQSSIPSSDVAAPKKTQIPPKPNHKPPPPSSQDKLPMGLLQLFTGITQPADDIGTEPIEGRLQPVPSKQSLAAEPLNQSAEPVPYKQSWDSESDKQSSVQEPTPPTQASSSDNQCEYGNLNLGPQLSIPIPVGQLDDYIKKKKASSTDSLKYEFSLLPSDQTKPWTVASHADVKTRNRFKNIIPYDDSRVPLEAIEGEPLSHYYNASYIQDYKKKNAFVAAMGPNTASLKDFWRLIWQEKFNIIVMATRLVENGKEKCKRYWPTTVGQEERYGKTIVKLLELESFSDYAISTLQVYQAGRDDISHTIKHFNMITWPDMGVPLYPSSVLDLVQVVKDAQTQLLARNSAEADKPLLVHCSAGVGRTGTFIAIYTLLDMMAEQGEVSVFRFVNQMRENRVNMVQTYEQYVFIYSALLEAHVGGDTRIPVKHFIERFAKLKKINPKTRRRYIDEEFQKVNHVTPPPGQDAYGAALLPENVDKNRFPDVLPLERNRPCLTYEGEDNSSYINASFVDSFHRKDAFITTQMPLPDTMVDFWRLVYDWNCSTIVMMNGSHTLKNEPVQYWPDSGGLVVGSLCVEMVDHRKERVYNSTTLEVSRIGSSESNNMIVKHFQLNGWARNEDKPNSPQLLLDLVDAVNRWQAESQSTGPILVQCINGVGRSGVFCAVWTVLERMVKEEVVDVFQAVKRLRMNQPQMIESLEQFILCYEVVHQHLERFQHYDNLL
ncbi:uncharacterized protein LOC110982770 isoform X2 [Acanthaster planci]|uniref:protein-tyrosine-phosphatase n=1 Tax=Acanthaster planci TaxID=133434 RepID=A0A8B7YWP5_ACAPL|nr:uncharacterized protein LOC110982770 isoform X2 [Acanthaster planci]